MGMHSRWVGGNLLFYDTAPYKWLDGWGPSICKHVDEFVSTPTDDTTGLPTAYTCTLVGTSTAVPTGLAGGGLLITTGGTENNGVNMQLKGEAFKLVAGKPCYFGARLLISDAIQSDFLVGLCITDTDLLGGMTDGVYFRKVDGATAVTFVVEQDSTETESATVLAADTGFHIYEFFWDGAALVAYIDGVAVSTPTLANLPDDEELTPSIHFLTGEGGAKTMQVDWMRCIQINA